VASLLHRQRPYGTGNTTSRFSSRSSAWSEEGLNPTSYTLDVSVKIRLAKNNWAGLLVTRKFKIRYWTLAGFCCFAVVSIWLSVQWWPSHAPREYEECSENAETKALSKEERATLIIQCGAQFAGRRKPSGGYTYYDFMQNRHFDIAGPNPSPEELKKIDQEYTGYLDVQRQDAIASALAKKQSDQIQADLEKAQQQPTGTTTSVGPPMVITPTNVPATGTKEPVDRSRATYCEDGSLSCSWSKFSAALKNAFGSAPKAKPQ
jgi:hypothetical protein